MQKKIKRLEVKGIHLWTKVEEKETPLQNHIEYEMKKNIDEQITSLIVQLHKILKEKEERKAIEEQMVIQ